MFTRPKPHLQNRRAGDTQNGHHQSRNLGGGSHIPQVTPKSATDPVGFAPLLATKSHSASGARVPAHTHTHSLHPPTPPIHTRSGSQAPIVNQVSCSHLPPRPAPRTETGKHYFRTNNQLVKGIYCCPYSALPGVCLATTPCLHILQASATQHSRGACTIYSDAVLGYFRGCIILTAWLTAQLMGYTWHALHRQVYNAERIFR